MSMELAYIIPAQNTLGECVLWHHETQTLWWTDIEEKQLCRLEWPSDDIMRIPLPERLGSFGFIENDDRLIGAFESGIALFDPIAETFDWLMKLSPSTRSIRFNDGRVDRQGRFWAGTMVEDIGPETPALGELYRVDRDGSVTIAASGILISNGICWSPDGQSLYFADSPRHQIYVCDANPESGTIDNRRDFAVAPKGSVPDGANTDSEGHLWSACWDGACIARYSPLGDLLETVPVPALQPTCVAFGGPDLDFLFVTSARHGLSAEDLEIYPQSGDVFVYKTNNVRGLREPYMKLCEQATRVH